jgi:transcriptional regulator with XRE-family HTH domain
MPHPHSREVGQRIAAARQRRGLSIRELALLLGWPRDTLVNFELGRRPITLERLHAIAVALDLPPVALLVDDHRLSDVLARIIGQPHLYAQLATFLDTLGAPLPAAPDTSRLTNCHPFGEGGA